MAMYISNYSVHNIDWNSLELMCIYIVEYRCFSNIGINLNSKYKFEFQKNEESTSSWPTVSITQNTTHLDLFKEYGINLKIICGMNGVGKTTILNLLRRNQHPPGDKYFVLFKDKNDQFLCTKDISIVFQGGQQKLIQEFSNVNLSNLTASQIERTVDDFHILKHLASNYYHHSDLFDYPDQPLFTHFNIDVLFEESNGEIVERVLTHDLGIEWQYIYCRSLATEYPLVYCFLHFCQDNTFDGVRAKIKSEINSIDELVNIFSKEEEYESLDLQVRSMFFQNTTETNPPKNVPFRIIFERKNQIKKEREINQEPRFYIFKTYSIIQEKWQQLEEKVFKFFSKLYPQEKRFHINSNVFDGLFYFRPVRLFHNGEVRTLYNLSHGEFFDVELKYMLLPRMAQTDGVWFDHDEADMHLHPEWKRQFLCNYLNTFQKTRQTLTDRFSKEKYADKVYSVILTTHSPFLLSDVPSEHIVYLEQSTEKTACGLPKTIVRTAPQNSFCGNIGEMFYSSFFMSETIGEFAKKKIEATLKDLDNKVSPERKKEISRLFDQVGDSLLKSLLDEKLAQSELLDEADKD